MMSVMCRSVLTLILILSLGLPAVGQDSTVTVEPDLRLFTMMVALNSAGFDVEFGAQYHPVREAVRKFAADLDPDLISRLKQFYAARKGIETDDAQLPKYISLAVSLGPPPEFKPLTREEFMPPDARSVFGFADLVREVYVKARVSQRWVDFRSQYEQAIARIAPTLRDMIVRTDAYLRVPLGAVSGRRMGVYLELAAPINTVNVRSSQDDYYVVIGDAPTVRIDDIRHAYLHFQLDALVLNNISKIQNTGPLLALVARAEGVEPSYTSGFHVMATESLIRAIELRMDRVAAAPAKASLDSSYRLGLLLTPYFYETLAAYETGESGIREAFGDFAKGIQLKTERQRFDETFSKIPVPQRTAKQAEVPQAAPEPLPDPTRDLLKQGEAAFNSGSIEKAKTAFERVLADFDRENGAALYGLALIAGKEGDSDEAERYFERAIASATAEPSMKVWSYIYLARIYDLDCDREKAILFYQQAIKVGDNSRNAQAAALEGTKKPYGDGCK